jgi:hypothetical protein
MIRAYLEAAQALGQALINGEIQAFKDSMTASAATLGDAYLADLLEKSKALQRHLV